MVRKPFLAVERLGIGLRKVAGEMNEHRTVLWYTGCLLSGVWATDWKVYPTRVDISLFEERFRCLFY